MDSSTLLAKLKDYEDNVCSNLEILDVYKNNNEQSKKAIIADIKTASEQAINLIKRLETELIKDTVAHLNQQLRDYEVYENTLNSAFSWTKEKVTSALDEPQRQREAAIKLNKALYALEKPTEKVVSFLSQYQEISKRDIGVIVIDTIQSPKQMSSEKRPLKKKLEKHGAVRLPLSLTSKVAGPGYCSTPSIASPEPVNRSIPTFDLTCDSNSSQADDGEEVDGKSVATKPPGKGVDLMTSAEHAWSLLVDEDASPVNGSDSLHHFYYHSSTIAAGSVITKPLQMQESNIWFHNDCLAISTTVQVAAIDCDEKADWGMLTDITRRPQLYICELSRSGYYYYYQLAIVKVGGYDLHDK